MEVGRTKFYQYNQLWDLLYSVQAKLVNFSGSLSYVCFVLFCFIQKTRGNQKTVCNYGPEAIRKHVDLSPTSQMRTIKQRNIPSHLKGQFTYVKILDHVKNGTYKVKKIKITKFKMIIIFSGRASVVLVTFHFSN